MDNLNNEQQLQRYQEIISCIGDWVWEVNAEGQYTFVDGNVSGILGYEPHELIGKTPFHFMPDDEATKIGKVFGEILTNKAPIIDLENWNIAKDGKPVCLLTNGIPIIDDKGTIIGYRGVDKNITPRKQRELLLTEEIKQRKKAEEDLREQVNVAHSAKKANIAKSKFLSNMSHELRTPLNAILGFSQLFEIYGDNLDNKQKNNVKEIINAGQHLLFLINELLDLAQIESGKIEVKMEPVSIDKILNECTELLQPQVAIKKLSLINHVSGKGYIVNADYNRLKQVLLNILSNAIKYNHLDGDIIIESTFHEGTIKHFHGHTYHDNDEHIQINITNTGVPLSDSQIERLFTPFERLDVENDIEGTGIGLVICKNLVELMNGSIGVKKYKDIGNTFWIELSLNK